MDMFAHLETVHNTYTYMQMFSSAIETQMEHSKHQ